ncbi:MAG: phosphate ABC transporter permease PstA [Hyphomicrobiaceae bacterium]|nr:phosphate ABC transporter permease PstA [Hyphomicrobiaceae bacterium]
MTDMAAPSPAFAGRRVDTTSDAARALVRKRYRSEARFRAYGLIAIAATAVFLVVLIADIIIKALPALTQHSLVLDVAVPSDLVDPGKRSDAAAIRSADYFPVTRDALKAAIPGIESRSAERTLTRLLSNGTADKLIAMLVANPSLFGQTVKVPLLLSANADLYLKGIGTPVTSRGGRGTATPSGTTGEVTVLTSSNDFAGELVSVKQLLVERARLAEQEADRLQRYQSGDLAGKIKELREQAAAFRARIDQPKVDEVLDGSLPSLLVAINGGIVKITRLSDVAITGDVLLPLSSTADAKPGDWKIVTYSVPESNRKATDLEVTFLERFKELGRVERTFNSLFLIAGDSREPELAGIRGAIVGSALTLFITLALCLPIGVLAAIYLEEFAPKNRLTDLIEVNINNLAAVPSIVFGLLGLAMFLNFFGLPRSAPLVGGLVLALLVLPTIIIAARAALKAVPPSIKEAALGVGASHQQAVFHHILPLAIPGIMTGTIIGMAHALGETAPLLMIGMVAFVVDVPKTFTEAATVLPVQIYLWSDLPEPAFQYKTAAAILVLLLFLFAMNGAAIWLRKKFERRW